MWSEETRNNLYKELEIQLDNKNFFDAKAYYSSQKQTTVEPQIKSFSSNLTYAKESPVKNAYDYESTVKGMSFSNKVEKEKKQITIDDLSLENRKIYKIADLLSANLVETVVIPYNVMPMSLSLVKKFDWKDVLFSDVSTAWGMIKNKFNW